MLQLIFSLGSFSHVALAEDATQYQFRAVYLFHFANFVRWPETAFAVPGKFVICVIGLNPFPEALRELEGERVATRHITIRSGVTLGQLGECQIVYAAPPANRDVAGLITSAAGHPILLVGDDEGFARRGGMMNFRVEGNRLRLNINHTAVRAAGLSVSARLLQLSQLVETRRDQAGEPTGYTTPIPPSPQ